MNLASLHLPVAAMLHWTDYVPADELMKGTISNFLNSSPILLNNETFSYPSPCQTPPVYDATLWEYAQVQKTTFLISRQVVVAEIKNLCHFLWGQILVQLLI